MIKRITTATLAVAILAAGSPALAATQRVATEHMDLLSGRSQLFSTDSKLERVAVSNPKIANVRVISGSQIMVQGLMPGTTTLMVWTKKGGAKSYEITVGLDAVQVQNQVHAITGNDDLRVAFNGSTFLISGPAESIAQREMAEKIVSSYGQPVVNLVQMPQRMEQIQVDVSVVELTKTGKMQLGWTPGGGEITDFTNGVRKYIFKPGQVMAGEATPGQISSFGQIDFLAARIDALQQRGEAKLLARPSLVVTDGGTAKFLVGGEIPIPIQQALGTTTIAWKEFGIRLEVSPTITPGGRVSMKVAPEVSSLDFANGVKMASFTIPALKSRRTETSVVLAPSETLMLSGLMNNEQTKAWMGLPFLADIPILGYLFRSTDWMSNKTELAVFVTPHMIAPGEAGMPKDLDHVRNELQQDLKQEMEP